MCLYTMSYVYIYASFSKVEQAKIVLIILFAL